MKTFTIKTVALVAASMLTTSVWAKMLDMDGNITDNQGQPLEFVNVSLLTSDSVYVQGAMSDVNGHFQIQTPVDRGILKVSYVGYRTRYVNVCGLNAGTVALTEDASMLDEVTVSGQLPKTKLTGNSMVTTVQGTVLSQSGTALEMLAKVPGMTSKDEELEVLGKGTPVIYINGMKMHDKDELKRLRSEEIQSVEVITNPGALYDATVTSVVKIKTVKRKGEGFGFDLMTNTNQDLAYGHSDPNASVNLRYRHQSLDLFGTVNYWKWDEINDLNFRQSTVLRTEDFLKVINQKSSSMNVWSAEGLNYTLGFNWQISENHSLGVRVQRHDRFNGTNKMTIETDLKQSVLGEPNPFMKEWSHTDQPGKDRTPYNWDGNAYYSGKIGQMDIDLNVDFMTNKESSFNLIYEDKEDKLSTKMEQSDGTKSSLWAAKLVLAYPIWKGQLQAGAEYCAVRRSSNSSFYSYASIYDSPLPASDSKVDENNLAIFAAYAANLGKWGNVSAGLRYEHVGFDYTNLLDDALSLSRYQDELFPDLSWSRQFGQFQTSVAYSFKTIRPRYDALNDRFIYVNSYSLLQGDPTLKNATMQEVSVNVHRSWLGLFAAYERRDNTLTQQAMAYGDQGVILIKRVNMDNPLRNLAVFLTANPTWGVYSPSWTAGGQKFWNTMTFDDPQSPTGKSDVHYTKPIFFFDLNNAFRLKHSWQLEANATIQTKGDVMNFRMRSNSCNLGFVVQKCWLPNNALCLRASVSDVLQRSVQRIEQDCAFYHFSQDTHNSNHRLNISLRYTFNDSKSKYKGTGAGKDEQQRMSKS